MRCAYRLIPSFYIQPPITVLAQVGCKVRSSHHLQPTTVPITPAVWQTLTLLSILSREQITRGVTPNGNANGKNLRGG